LKWVYERNRSKIVPDFSGGQRRRISIGTTLVTRSSLIMLDEPTAGIDPITRRQIWQLLQAIRQQGIAILLTSHSMDECEELCNKIAFMNQGTLIGIGSSQHLKTRLNDVICKLGVIYKNLQIRKQLYVGYNNFESG
jgi:ABC-type multidrug transport system ATPase subunit